jgi:hypothetical protein
MLPFLSAFSHYATSRKVAGSRPDEDIEFCQSFQPYKALGVHSAPNRNDDQKQTRMFLRSRARRARKADNLTAICEPIVGSVGSSTSHNPIGLHGLLRG